MAAPGGQPAVYCLRVDSGAQRGERIPLPPGGDEPIVLGIGRGGSSHLRFHDGTISRQQAELRWEGGAWFLLNLSRHGSYVGSKLLAAGRQRKLQPGDVLLLGETQVVFEVDPGAVATPGADALTPRTPSAAAPPELAGYDSRGQFHAGQTLLDLEDEGPHSFVYLLGERAGVKVKRRRLYYLGVLALLGVCGTIATLTLIVLPALAQYPRDFALATLVALLPALPYLLLFKALDRNDQIPWSNLLACVVWGATVGCGFSLVLNTQGSRYLGEFLGAGEAFTTTAILVAPLVEEVTKGMAVLVLFLILRDEFDDVLEGLVLGAASGLGFALVENCIYNVRFLAQGPETLWVMGTYRTVVNALIGHPIYTAMAGAGLGLLRATPRERRARYLYPIAGLLLAIGLHVAWNATAVHVGRALGEESALTLLLLNALLLGGAGLALFLGVYVYAWRRERRVLVTYLAEELETGFVERAELDSFHAPFGRLAYELEGLRRHGWRVYRHRRALRRAQVELAFRKWHLAMGDAVHGEGYDRQVQRLRARIRDERNVLNQLEGQDPSDRPGAPRPSEEGPTTEKANPLVAPPPPGDPAA